MKLRGSTQVPGDKSISHRALLLSSISNGESAITGLNCGADCVTTRECLVALGADIYPQGRDWRVRGRGLTLQKPKYALDCANSGTTLRLLAGLLAGQDFLGILTGDASLRRRPMARIVEPLRLMGADLYGPGGSNFAPLSIRGGALHGINYELPVASAQVKSALLLAGLQAEGTTTVMEPVPCRDHTERMLKSWGANIVQKPGEISISRSFQLEAGAFSVPGDFSSAAFLLAAAAVLPGSELVLKNVGLNPTRLGFLEILQEMGAAIEILSLTDTETEPRGDILVRGSELSAVEVGGEQIPLMLDEVPILAVVATQAIGTTIIKDAGELRVKESDRLASIASELTILGADVQETAAGLIITGPTKLQGGTVSSHGDHRLALALAIAGLFAQGKVKVKGQEAGEISFPGFKATLSKLIEG